MADERSSGGNFYDDQFNARIDGIRGNNSPPPEPRSGFGWGRGGALGGSGLAGLVLLRLCVAGCISANNAAYQSQYYGQQSGTSSSAYSDPWQQQEPSDPAKKQRDDEFQRRQEEERRQELARRAAEHRDPVFVEDPEPQKQPGTTRTPPDRPKRKDDLTRPNRPNVPPRP